MSELRTPLRRTTADGAAVDGVWQLGETEIRYVESAELEVLEVLERATDLSSTSAELDAVQGRSAVTYHLSSRRPNVVRFLDLPPDAAVLEVGSGCGAVTRYLGETCATVDALEPMPRRARVARERCRDLATVEVFAGEVSDVPVEAAYDVVLVNGVMEYVGHGTADTEPYVRFLSDLARLLRPGGTLVLAIENRIGVKYVVGSPEDHTDREFDSLEGYPRPNHARVFSRRELVGLLETSGFGVDDVLAAFPDYKRTTVLMGESLDTVDPTLAWRIPTFPSPDRRGFRHRVADELAVWRTFVEAGLTWETPNSFVVLASVPGDGAALWPDGRHAVFARNVRRREFAVRTVLEDGDGGPTFRRELGGGSADRAHGADGGAADGGVDGVRMVARSAAYQPGTELLHEIAAATPEHRSELLALWSAMVDEAAWDDGAPLDLLPHNVVLAADGTGVLVDDEYRADGWDRDDVRARGVLTLGLKLAAVTSATQWPYATVAELVDALGEEVGLSGAWLDRALELEARLRAAVRPPGDVDHVAQLRAALARRFEDGPLDLQAVRRVERLTARLEAVEAEQALRAAEVAAAAAERDELARRLATIEATKGHRVLTRLRGFVGRARRVAGCGRRLAGRVLRRG